MPDEKMASRSSDEDTTWKVQLRRNQQVNIQKPKNKEHFGLYQTQTRATPLGMKMVERWINECPHSSHSDCICFNKMELFFNWKINSRIQMNTETTPVMISKMNFSYSLWCLKSSVHINVPLSCKWLITNVCHEAMNPKVLVLQRSVHQVSWQPAFPQVTFHI